MRQVIGDIWSFHQKGAWAVIPTNLQYNRTGAVMGAGLARQAAQRFPGLREAYGRQLGNGYEVMSLPAWRLFLLPTKVHWADPSTIWMIKRGLQALVLWSESHQPLPSVAVPKLGCGLGGLDWTEVKPLIEACLTAPNFALVIPENDTL